MEKLDELRAFVMRVRSLLLDHELRHEKDGSDELSIDELSGMPADLETHAPRHQDGGADEMALAGLPVSASDITSGTLPGIKFTSTEKAADYTATSTDLVIYVDADLKDAKITLPAVASHTNRVYYIKNLSLVGKVSITGYESEKVEGELLIELLLQGSYVMLHCDGTEWHIIGGGNMKIEDLISQQIEILEEIRDNAKEMATHLSLGSDEELKGVEG